MQLFCHLAKRKMSLQSLMNQDFGDDDSDSQDDDFDPTDLFAIIMEGNSSFGADNIEICIN